MLVPLRWNFLGDIPDLGLVYLFDPGKSRLKRLPTSYMLVNRVKGESCPEPQVRQIALVGIEAMYLVNEDGAVTVFLAVFNKYSLTAVAVAGPLIEGKHPGKVSAVDDPVEHCRWQVIKNSCLTRVGHVPRAKLPAIGTRHRSYAKVD